MLYAVNPGFPRRDDGLIDIDLGDSYPWFTDALLDAVTTRAPRGSDGVNPSTYWIDRTLTSLSSGEGRIASGNAWDLVVEDGHVVARSQYADAADPEPERVPVDEFIDALHRWRQEVIKDRS